MRLTFRPLFWPTGTLLICLPLLVALGSWQMHRLFWKQALLADIAYGRGAGFAPAGMYAPYRRGQLSLSFDTERIALVLTRTTYTLNYSLFMLARVQRGANPLHGEGSLHQLRPLQPWVWVRVGVWPSPEQAISAAFHMPDHPILAGIFRPSEPLRLISVHTHGLWLWPDIAAMTAQASLPPADVAPVWFDASAQKEEVWLELPSNHHLQYALTWWGLIPILLFVYISFHIKEGRLTLKP